LLKYELIIDHAVHAEFRSNVIILSFFHVINRFPRISVFAIRSAIPLICQTLFRVWKPNEQHIHAKKLKNSLLARGFCCSLLSMYHPLSKYPHDWREHTHNIINNLIKHANDFFFQYWNYTTWFTISNSRQYWTMLKHLIHSLSHSDVIPPLKSVDIRGSVTI